MRKKVLIRRLKVKEGMPSGSLWNYLYISPQSVRRNPLGNWVTLIFRGQKPCTRIISRILHSFLLFSRTINVISYPKKRISWESEKIDFKNFKFQRKGTLFLGPKSGFIFHAGDTLQHTKTDWPQKLLISQLSVHYSQWWELSKHELSHSNRCTAPLRTQHKTS